MTKPFMPPIDSWWRLTEDMHFDMLEVITYKSEDFYVSYFGGYGHVNWVEQTGETLTGDWPTRYWAWENERTKDGVTLPKGTVLQFDRYHVSRSGEDQITLMVIKSPNEKINPKKMGGKAKGKMRFYLSLKVFNRLGEMEQVNGTNL